MTIVMNIKQDVKRNEHKANNDISMYEKKDQAECAADGQQPSLASASSDDQANDNDNNNNNNDNNDNNSSSSIISSSSSNVDIDISSNTNVCNDEGEARRERGLARAGAPEAEPAAGGAARLRELIYNTMI